MYKIKLIFTNGFAEYYGKFDDYNEACNNAYNLFAENLYRGVYDFKVI
ncbi:hypothetical protein Rumal_3627 (plasmid) [Ruminococcus albus 7 = DSM 20455]|jgi:hypothetical protein|uniref:Uncharacterized protein n=1 Tax=Ruminococcus albus (strain ATCC 27210 / DSM 20455 / JCM 14654 / NCDO 2250 / 7) TaxID=697329 RepID=E6UK70_RUMA7|nr:hypothetical protein Rumal_3627 [Ruminococcus albus 7 = DSM 20455]